MSRDRNSICTFMTVYPFHYLLNATLKEDTVCITTIPGCEDK